MAAELGQRTVAFSEVVRRTAEDSFLALKELVEKSKAAEDQSDSQKKIDLLKYIFKTRQRMLRLHVLAKWCQQVPLVQYCQQLAGILSSHDACFTQAADSLFFTHEGLQQARAPVYDVPSAIEVLLTGNYRRLPKCIEDLGLQATLTDDQKKPVLKNLDALLRSKLLETLIPKEFSEVKVSDGTLLLHVHGEFKVLLTLGYRGHLSLWRILHLELQIGERSSYMKLEESRRYALGDELERRMASSENPFAILYSVLHQLCVALIMDTVIKQVQLLRQGRWKDAIRFELISEGENQEGEFDSTSHRTPGIKIMYWLEFDKVSGLPPFIKIEPVSDCQIRCVHSGFVVDPATEKEAEFSLDHISIDVEGLLLKAIACSKHTRLLEISRELTKIPQIFQGEGDVVLKCREDSAIHDSQKLESLEDEVLCVRAYGSNFITLGIAIRSGLFLIQCSKNILVPSALTECEEALNQGNMTAAEVFLSLRTKSIMHLFASVGKFLGFKVYETDLITLKIPRSIIEGSDTVLMEFSHCANCYYLLLHLDQDLRPLFKLLETLPDSGKCKHVSRYSIIDIDRIGSNKDESILSLSSWDKLQSLEPDSIGGSQQSLNLSVLSDVPSDNFLIHKGCSSPGFSSMVDQVFELEKGMLQGSKHSVLSGPMDSIIYAHVSHLSSSLSNQDLSLLKTSLHSGVNGLYYSMGHDQEKLLNEYPRDVHVTANESEPSTVSNSGSQISAEITSTGDRQSKKRSFADLVSHIPSFQELNSSLGQRKKTKSISPSFSRSKPIGHAYDSILSEVNRWVAPHDSYVSSLLNVIRRCSLSIKHAQVASQMDALEIPFVEEVCLHSASTNLWFRLPSARDGSWESICICLGKVGTMSWQVKVNDPYFRELRELQKGSSTTGWGSGVRITNASDNDSHICFDSEGVVLNYETVEVDSVKKLVSDLQRLWNMRFFAQGMRDFLGVRSTDDKLEGRFDQKQQSLVKSSLEKEDKLLELLKKAFKIEAVGLMSLWFCYGMMPVMVHFVVEWETGKDGCTMHVSPDQLWPHTKYLEDFINGGEVALFLDCVRLTVGPLLALAHAIRPARMPGPATSSSSPSPNIKHPSAPVLSSIPARGGPGIVPSSLLPFDVAVVLRGPYHIRIIYRKKFAVDMRCFAGDQVWLQPAPPPKAGGGAGGSLPCPQFRPFIMEHVAQGLNSLEPGYPSQHPMTAGSRVQRPGLGVPIRVSPVQLRGELNTAFIGLGDDGGYGGSWVPLAALKKVLRGILKYLGVLWLFAQLPELLKEILSSVFKENEGGLLNLDQEQPALRFFVGGYVFSVSVHKVQLLLHIISVKRVPQNPQQQPTPPPPNPQEELASTEIQEICDYFGRRVASEPYDTSRVSSFITLLTLPISVLREFLKLISWEKGFFQSGELAPSQRARVELSLENHSITAKSKSDIHHDRAHSCVDFGLTFVLDPALIPHMNAAGGAAWLPYCVSVRLRYSFGDNSLVSLMGMEGSHGGRACWARAEDWEKCKLRVARAVDFSNTSNAGESQGKLRSVAESLQKSLQLLLQQLRDTGPTSSTLTS